jgi:hypothetical protein
VSSPSVITGCLRDGHLLGERGGRGAADLTHRHPAECEQQVSPPFAWQGLPNRAGGNFDHRAIQASAPWRTMPGSQAAAVRRVVSTYQRRLVWDIELFFKWIKQHLRIKRFYGTSENAVKTQIWITVSVYVLVAIIKKQLGLEASLYTLMQVISVTILEKSAIQTALSSEMSQCDTATENNQLNLFGF